MEPYLFHPLEQSQTPTMAPSFEDLHSHSSFADSIDRAPWRSKPELSAILPQPEVSISRTTTIPNDLAVARCHRLPEYGPRILFFSGGSALRHLSETLKNYTHNSIHLITPFDSGGSSAEIRKAFTMLSVGDLRNRLMALSDDSNLRNPHVKELFSYRLSRHEPLAAQADFRDFLSGRHALCQYVSLPMRRILSSHLRWFASRMPPDFDLCGASIGNLIITGCFLEHDSDIVTAIYLIWKLLGVKGKVRPLTAANLHLRAHYENGNVEIGQHLLGKHEPTKRIVKIDLVEFPSSAAAAQAQIAGPAEQRSRRCHIDMVSAELVNSADVLCYPMGSFFGSLLVNLLPIGVGKAIVQRHCPKVYIPNTGQDPEMYGYSLTDCIQQIIDMVQVDVSVGSNDNDQNAIQAAAPVSDILNFVLLDTKYCAYCIDIDAQEISSRFGIQVLDLCLVDDATKVTVETMLEKSCELNSVKVVEVLLTLGS
jgi:CofD-related protein of GAK system